MARSTPTSPSTSLVGRALARITGFRSRTHSAWTSESGSSVKAEALTRHTHVVVDLAADGSGSLEVRRSDAMLADGPTVLLARLSWNPELAERGTAYAGRALVAPLFVVDRQRDALVVGIADAERDRRTNWGAF